MADDADRGFIDWRPNAASGALPDQILTVIQDYRDAGVPAPTVRDVVYNLIGRYGYEKSDSLSDKVYRLLRKMRRVRSGPYKIGFDEIDDDSPTTETDSGWDATAQFWRGVWQEAEGYYRDLQQGQEQRVIVLTEGASKVRQFRTVTRDYDIPVFSGGGWESIKLKRDLARGTAGEYLRNGRPTLAFHCGDFDPDGVGIFEAGIDDVRAFLSDDLPDDAPVTASEVLRVKRIMLLPGQRPLLPEGGITPFDRGKLKKNDHRGRKWPHDWRAELETLLIPDRLEILRSEIDAVVDHDLLLRVREQGERERAEIMARIDELLDGRNE